MLLSWSMNSFESISFVFILLSFTGFPKFSDKICVVPLFINIGFLLNTFVCHFSTLTFGLFVLKGNEYVYLLVSAVADLNEG